MFPDEEIKYEHILHTVWSEQLFTQAEFTSTTAENIKVLNPGYLNPSDGPDFLNAVVQIGSMVHYGAVEIHLNSRDWTQHNHHNDANYNQVILHVVADFNKIKEVFTKTGDKIPTVNIRPYLPKQVHDLIGAMAGSGLPCSNIAHFISEEAFFQQLEKVQLEYLEKKVQDFYAFYDASAVMSIAWKKALQLSLADGFGIPHNRAAMVQATRAWLRAEASNNPFNSGQQFSGFILESEQFNFSRKGVRPAHRPEQRLPQLHAVMQAINKLTFTDFIDLKISRTWNLILAAAGISKSGFSKILYGTVYLPAHLSLSQLVHSSKLRQNVYHEWGNLEVKIPEHIGSKFSVFPKQIYTYARNNLGTVHLYHAYCKEKRCLECRVLNKAILS